MQALTPASAGDLPPLAELAAGEQFWRCPAGAAGRDGVAHLRVWATTTDPAGHLAVVTGTGRGACVPESAGGIRAGLARGHGPALVLPGHDRAPESEEGAETLDLVRIGAGGSPRWSRVRPTPQDNPVTAGSSCGWPATATRSPAGRLAGPAGVRADAAWVTTSIRGAAIGLPVTGCQTRRHG